MKTVHSTVFLFINNLLKNKTPVESINNTAKAKSYFQKKKTSIITLKAINPMPFIFNSKLTIKVYNTFY